MKFSLMLLIYLISTLLFAYPCPNGNILYKGDSVEELLKQCGSPSLRHTTQQNVNREDEWIYYLRHAFDSGYSQLIISFTNNFVSKMHVNEYYPYYQCFQSIVPTGGGLVTSEFSCGNRSYNAGYTNLCGPGFGIGESVQVVRSICGIPASQANLNSVSDEITEFTYQGEDPITFIIQNGKVLDWRE